MGLGAIALVTGCVPLAFALVVVYWVFGSVMG